MSFDLYNLASIKLWKKPEFYLGQIPFLFKANKEERDILFSLPFEDLSITHKFFQFSSMMSVKTFINHLEEWGLLNFLCSLKSANFDDICAALTKEFHFLLDTSKRKKMLHSLLNILVEVEIAKKEKDIYIFSKVFPRIQIPIIEQNYVEQNITSFKFFKTCLDKTLPFLKGETNLIDFSSKNAQVWEWLLGSPEGALAKQIALKAMRIKHLKNPRILDLCFGRGYSTIEILKEYPNSEVSAIDYVDDHIKDVKEKIKKLEEKTNLVYSVNFISSEKWIKNSKKGFGVPLPFDDNTFDAILSPGVNAFIAPSIREFVYGDMYRILKPNGVISALFHSYPDEMREIHKNKWERCQIYFHNFCECVVDDFNEIYDYEPTYKMFKDIGFTTKGFPTDNFCILKTCWRMRK